MGRWDMSLCLCMVNSSAPRYHKSKTIGSAMLLPVAAPTVGGVCVCAHEPAPFGAGKGKFVYTPVSSDAGIPQGR